MRYFCNNCLEENDTEICDLCEEKCDPMKRFKINPLGSITVWALDEDDAYEQGMDTIADWVFDIEVNEIHS